MLTLLTIIFFTFGLIIGSFLNVVIARYNTERGFGGRSACMSCRTTLHWFDLVPLGSYLILGGRCRTCSVRISMQYPMVELVTGLIFALLFLKFQNIFLLNTLHFALTYAFYGTLFALLIVIATYDLKHKIIPDAFSFAFGALSFLGIFIFGEGGLGLHVPHWSEFLSGIFIALPFALLWLLSRGAWMGLGDGKLALGLGWMLGLSRALSGIVLAFWTGALVGIFLMVLSRNYKMRTEIPFAPFLVFGAIVAFLFDLNIFF